MTKKIVFLSLLFLRTYSHSSGTSTGNSLPANISAKNFMQTFSATLIKVSGSTDNQRTVIKWQVGDNQSADMFEVEKSCDGINYKIAALVFSSEKKSLENYWFVDKADDKKVLYRIKLINKNKEVEYSEIIEISPV